MSTYGQHQNPRAVLRPDDNLNSTVGTIANAAVITTDRHLLDAAKRAAEIAIEKAIAGIILAVRNITAPRPYDARAASTVAAWIHVGPSSATTLG